MQAPNPIFLKAAGIAYWQNSDMRPTAFDPDLVRRTLKEKGVSQTQIAKDLNFTSQSAISNMLTQNPNAKPRKASSEEAFAIYQYLGLLEDVDVGAPVQTVPLIGFAAAGSWSEAIANPMGERTIARRTAGPRSFAVEIVGDSMDKLLPQGGWAVVDPDQRGLLNGKVYLIENDEHETTVKMYKSEPARFAPVSTNDGHQEMLLDDIRYRVIGRILTYGGDA